MSGAAKTPTVVTGVVVPVNSGISIPQVVGVPAAGRAVQKRKKRTPNEAPDDLPSPEKCAPEASSPCELRRPPFG
jgi:hypothetical protein